MNFLYTINNAFFVQLIVSIKSLINNTDGRINIYIICDDLTEGNKKKLISFSKDLVNIKLLPAPDIPNKLMPDRGSISQFYRLLIGQIFKNVEITKVVYLDADTLINDNLEELFRIDMKDYVIGAALDPWSLRYRKLLNIDDNSKMLNSGVLLIDVEQWKKKNLDNSIRCLVNNRKNFIQGDQGILDEALKGDFFTLDPKFNVISSYFEFSFADLIKFRNPHIFYDRKYIENAINHPAIVHFTSSFLNNRPWYIDSKHPFGNEWRLIYKEMYNKDYIQVKCTGNLSLYIYKYLPHRIAIKILGLLQTQIRPILLKYQK